MFYVKANGKRTAIEYDNVFTYCLSAAESITLTFLKFWLLVVIYTGLLFTVPTAPKTALQPDGTTPT